MKLTYKNKNKNKKGGFFSFKKISPAKPTISPKQQSFTNKLRSKLSEFISPRKYAVILYKASKNKDVKEWINSVTQTGTMPGYTWLLVSAGGKQHINGKTKKQILQDISKSPDWRCEMYNGCEPYNGNDGFLYMLFPLLYNLDKPKTDRLVAQLKKNKIAYAYLLTRLNNKGEFEFNLS